MQAPQITLTDDNNQPQQPQSYNRNGYDTNKIDPPPTPRSWEFNWESSPGQIVKFIVYIIMCSIETILQNIVNYI
ncbi:MAG: hypothetical protein GY755_02165 [Chloroflexi bacterium]|nr:hypothetical protein [Chloroflexota bacterium]